MRSISSFGVRVSTTALRLGLTALRSYDAFWIASALPAASRASAVSVLCVAVASAGVGNSDSALIQAVSGRERVLLGFKQRDGDGLGFGVQANPQGVVGATGGAAASLAGDDLDGAERLLAAGFCLHWMCCTLPASPR